MGAGSAALDEPKNKLSSNEELAVALLGVTGATCIEADVRVVHPDLKSKYVFKI